MDAVAFDQSIERFQQAGNEFHKENHEPDLKIFSQREDSSAVNPFSPAAQGGEKVVGSQDFVTVALRATVFFCGEEGTWKIVLRHADLITTDQPAKSIIQKLALRGSRKTDYATVPVKRWFARTFGTIPNPPVANVTKVS